MSLKNICIFTGILFILSLVVYFNENKRGTGLLLGAPYITGLDLEKIQKIELDFKGDDDIILTKQEDAFFLEKHKNYPADSGKVNDLLYKISSIEIKEQITSNANDQNIKDYELSEELKRVAITLYDHTGKKILSFRIGKEHSGKGNYLLKNGEKAVYLSTNPLYIGSSPESFIEKNLLAVNEKDIQQVLINSKKKKEKENYANHLANLVFQEYFTKTDSKIRDLRFTNNVSVHLKNKLIYNIAFAKKGDDHFVKINASVDETIPKEVIIRKENAKEDIQNAGNIFKTQSKARLFNKRKSNWIYKIYKSSYENLI